MKNLIILLFSIFLLAGCQKEQDEVIVKKQAALKQDSNHLQPLGLQLKYVQEHQNGVFDTSSTSIKAALVEQQLFAKQVEENTYQASLLQDRVNQKVKKMQKLEAGIDSTIRRLEEFTKLNKKRRDHEDKYVVLE